jgi:hypothetical protein
MLTKLALTLTALALLGAPARADCARMVCEWHAVEKWLSQQRAEAEARARTWQLFGPQPSPARIEQVRQWLDERSPITSSSNNCAQIGPACAR